MGIIVVCYSRLNICEIYLATDRCKVCFVCLIGRATFHWLAIFNVFAEDSQVRLALCELAYLKTLAWDRVTTTRNY